MNDVISRQAVIDALEKKQMPIMRSEFLYDQAKFDGLSVALNIITELPPAQPEIIYCKDCKYAEYIDDVQTLWCTECGQGRTVAPCDFCSYAERRE